MMPMKTFSPFRMEIPPFPMESTGPAAARPPMDGFVAEEAISAHLAAPSVTSRKAPVAADLVLSSDPDDFAGWTVQQTSPFRIMAAQQRQESAPAHPAVGMASPVRIAAVQAPPQQNRLSRWWLAGMATAAGTAIVSILFIQLAGRNEAGSDWSQLSSHPVRAVQSMVGTLYP